MQRFKQRIVRKRKGRNNWEQVYSWSLGIYPSFPAFLLLVPEYADELALARDNMESDPGVQFALPDQGPEGADH